MVKLCYVNIIYCLLMKNEFKIPKSKFLTCFGPFLVKNWPFLHLNKVFQNHVMRWITGHRLRDKIPIIELHTKTGLQPLSVNIKKTKLRWFGHMKRSNLPVKTTFVGMIEGKRCQGRPKRRWRDDISEWVGDTWSSINNLARDRNRWRRMLDAI